MSLVKKKKIKLRVLKFYSKEAVELLVLMLVGYLVSAEFLCMAFLCHTWKLFMGLNPDFWLVLI